MTTDLGCVPRKSRAWESLLISRVTYSVDEAEQTRPSGRGVSGVRFQSRAQPETEAGYTVHVQHSVESAACLFVVGLGPLQASGSARAGVWRTRVIQNSTAKPMSHWVYVSYSLPVHTVLML